MNSTISTLLGCLAIWLMAISPVTAADDDLASSSFLGGSGATDRVTGARVLSDGTLALAANLFADVHPGNLTPILLNGATVSSTGAVVRLSADGRKVLSVTRVATQINDLAVDASDRIYIAAHDQGILPLSVAADTLLWRQAEASGRYAWRVDAGNDGHCVALDTTTADVTSAQPGSVTVSIYDVAGTLLSSAAGYRYTLDVCLDSDSQSVILCGWRQANTVERRGNAALHPDRPRQRRALVVVRLSARPCPLGCDLSGGSVGGPAILERAA